MTREEEIREKARELAIKHCKDIDPHGKEVYNIGCAIACCEMADWIDKHPKKGLWNAEKVIEWLQDNADSYTWYDEFRGESGMIDDFIQDLRKAMED